MQSWGTQSRFTERDTGLEPSKSGVIGLLCAALGRPRAVPVDDLAALRMGVRADAEGTVQIDFHTTGGSRDAGAAAGVARASGGRGGTVLSNRAYLADADFLVGFSGLDLDLLTRLDAALAAPRWPLFLGRKAFVPGLPVRLPNGGLRLGLGLEDALRHEPRSSLAPARRSDQLPPDALRLVLEDDAGTGGDVRYDQPVGAAFADRRFLPRRVVTTFCDPPPAAGPEED